jgi:hypothetical protein
MPYRTLGEYELELCKAMERVRAINIFRSDIEGGNIEWEGDVVTALRWDPLWRGLGTTVVHELIHYQRRTNPEAVGALDEPSVLGIEKAMWKFIMRRKPRWRWWRRAIYSRLRGKF